MHGGNNTSRVWERLQPLLDAPSLAVELPGRGDRPAELSTLTLDDVAASVRDDVDAWNRTDQLVVVAHSSAALSVPRLSTMLRQRVARIVLVPGSIPPEGGCGIDTMRPHQAVRLREWLGLLDAEGLPRTSNYGVPDREVLRMSYGGTALTDDQLEFVEGILVPDSLNVFLDPVSWRDVRDVPVTWVRTLQDRVQPREMQDEFIARLSVVDVVEVVDIDSGHIPAVTNSAELAAVLNGVLPAN
jgi:pimeloyl-ACP methyl ester carboxylesterase